MCADRWWPFFRSVPWYFVVVVVVAIVVVVVVVSAAVVFVASLSLVGRTPKVLGKRRWPVFLTMDMERLLATIRRNRLISTDRRLSIRSGESVGSSACGFVVDWVMVMTPWRRVCCQDCVKIISSDDV